MSAGWAAVRSVLLVSLPDEVPVQEALASGADAVILDFARAAALPLARPPVPLVAVRVARDQDDLAAVLAIRPDVLVLLDCRGLADVDRIAGRAAVAEAERGFKDGATGVVASVADGAAGLVALMAGPTFAGASPRLMALTWDPSDLRHAFGEHGGAAGLARGLVPVAARAAGLAALAPEDDGDTGDGGASRRMGYTGQLTRNPARIARINAIFGAPRA